MGQTFDIAVFEGDGIGPEITAPTVELLRALAAQSGQYGFAFQSHPAGAAHYAKTGDSLPEASLKAAEAADAILLSAMGLPDVRYEDGTEISPQIDLRKAFKLFAGVRPVRVAPGGLTPLNLPEGKGIDFVLIRETSPSSASFSTRRPPNTLTLWRTMPMSTRPRCGWWKSRGNST